MPSPTLDMFHAVEKKIKDRENSEVSEGEVKSGTDEESMKNVDGIERVHTSHKDEQMDLPDDAVEYVTVPTDIDVTVPTVTEEIHATDGE